MNPGSMPTPLEVDRVAWIPSSPDAIEVQVFGAWRGASVPSRAVLVVAGRRVAAAATPPEGAPAPAWSSSFLAPVEARAELEEGAARLEIGGHQVVLPAARPGVLGGGDPGTVVDPQVLAERRARRDAAAAPTGPSAEDVADTLRAQLEHLEVRVARATDEREQLAGRVADAERRLRLAEQESEEAQRRRVELETESAGAVGRVEAEISELRERLAAAESAAEGLQRELQDARRRQEQAERGARDAAASPTPTERALRFEVERLERQVEERTAAQERMAEVVAIVRTELEQVRVHVEEAHQSHAAEEQLAAMRRQLLEMESRRATLEDALRAQTAEVATAASELDTTRAALQTAQRDLAAAQAVAAEAQRTASELAVRLEEERALRAQAEAQAARGGATDAPFNRRELQARLDEVVQDVSALRGRLREATAELETRLAGEREQRLAVEAELAALRASISEGQASAPAGEPGDDALETLVAGLRAQVAAARRQLDEWGADESDAPRVLSSLDPAPPPPASAPPQVQIDDVTRERLKQIESELHAALPDESSGRDARDIISDLQRAAERLRETAEEELERLDGEEGASVEAAPAEPASAPEPEPPAAELPRVPLGARDGVAQQPEGPWLGKGLVRLAERDANVAARLVETLLPAQRGAMAKLTYDLVAAGVGVFRVTLSRDAVTVQRRDGAGPRSDVDAIVEGPLEAVAPLVTGDAAKRLEGADVRGRRRRVRRLLRARREPVGLADLARSGVPVETGLVLAALAAAVDPVWTAGQSFAVRIEIADEGTWTVVADDGRALRVETGDGVDAAVTVRASRGAVLPLLAGAALPFGQEATAEGDSGALSHLLGWFDRARAGGNR